jgi:hypothetical protein
VSPVDSQQVLASMRAAKTARRMPIRYFQSQALIRKQDGDGRQGSCQGSVVCDRQDFKFKMLKSAFYYQERKAKKIAYSTNE